MCNATTSLLQVICLSFVVVQTVQSYNFSQNLTRIRRQSTSTKCPSSNFACKSGECIDGDKECDGTVDCQDASDESIACHRIKCPPFLFRCDYGACISSDLECDGKPDCRDGSDENTSKCKAVDDSSPQCKSNEFRCSNGQCIDEDNKCDGIAQCSDRSDEISATCWNLPCPNYTYKCKYGACVNGNAECNGKVECQDGSDEDPSICKTPIPTVTPAPPPQRPKPGSSPGSCTLPSHPEFGEWSVSGQPEHSLNPGDSVTTGTILKMTCKKQHLLQGASFIFCESGKWNTDLGKCLKLCPVLDSTETMRVTCTFENNVEVENCTGAIDGTLAKYKCAPFYEDLNLQRLPVRLCRDGTWDNRKPDCAPVCGQKSVDAQKLIVNGTPVKKGNYPWQAALYTVKNKELICGGSLVRQNVIITAAHCMTDQDDKPLPKENYIVAVGKYYRKFNDPRDANEAQFSEISQIFLAEQYGGAVQNFVGDIAILFTKKTFVLSLRVQPVCMNWNGEFDLFTSKSEYGYVTGWGFTAENANPSDELKELKVPLISSSKCLADLAEDFHRYHTFDKFCAGFLDNGTSVCKGDSGGGLVVKYEGRYYLTGIVSLSPNAPTGGCDSQQYGLYTKVSSYVESFIIKKMSRFKG